MVGVFSLPSTGVLKSGAPSTLGPPGRDGADFQTSSIPNRYALQWLVSLTLTAWIPDPAPTAL